MSTSAEWGPQTTPAAWTPTGPSAGPAGGPPVWPDHPKGTTVLVLGILSLTLLVTAPFAWYQGARAEREIAASGRVYANRHDIAIGRILGMVMTIVGLVGIIGYAAVAVGLAVLFYRTVGF